jgi:hypothetical protein
MLVARSRGLVGVGGHLWLPLTRTRLTLPPCCPPLITESVPVMVLLGPGCKLVRGQTAKGSAARHRLRWLRPWPDHISGHCTAPTAFPVVFSIICFLNWS